MNKKPWASKTLWGIVITGVSAVLTMVGQEKIATEVEEQTPVISEGLAQIGVFVGLIVATIGRILAEKPIS